MDHFFIFFSPRVHSSMPHCMMGTTHWMDSLTGILEIFWHANWSSGSTLVAGSWIALGTKIVGDNLTGTNDVDTNTDFLFECRVSYEKGTFTGIGTIFLGVLQKVGMLLAQLLLQKDAPWIAGHNQCDRCNHKQLQQRCMGKLLLSVSALTRALDCCCSASDDRSLSVVAVPHSSCNGL